MSDFPQWASEVIISREDVLEALEFYTHFNIPLKPEVKALKERAEADPFYTISLADQVLFTKTVLADLAAGSDAFGDEMFLPMTIVAAENLVAFNKASIEELKKLEDE